MKARDLFHVVVATIGLWIATQGLLSVIDGVLCALNLYELKYGSAKFYATRGAIETAIGFAILRGFPPFVDIVFGPERKEENDDASHEQDNVD